MYLLEKMKKVLAILTMLVLAVAMPLTASASGDSSEEFDPKEVIFHHLGDGYGWEVPFSHTHRIPLPVIVFDKEGSLHMFSSSHITGGESYTDNGVEFVLPHEGEYSGKVGQVMSDGSYYRPLDFSITKNVCALFISAFIVILMAFSMVRYYKKKGMKAPRKGAGFYETIFDFIYSGVLKGTLGDKAPKFAGYLMTVFFFIFTMNLLGLIVIFPGGANLTGNVAVTLVLALCTFLITNIKGNKHYWKDIFWPDVPLMLKFPLPIMPIIELFGTITKPAALCVRLFANMMGGHMIVIVLTLLIFIFAKFGAAVLSVTTAVSMAFSLFMLLLDVLISFIQAYVFTMLSTLFISLAVSGGHEEEAKH